jgi:hypothetical protein
MLLILWLVPAAWLLSTPVGKQALVDEHVRITEAFGGSVSDAQYAALQQMPPWMSYLSGTRLLLTPPLTLLVACGLMGMARWQQATLSLMGALSVSVQASLVLGLQQAVVTPLMFLRESVTNMTNLATVLPGIEDGSLPARLFGSIDMVALWWGALLALGLSAATGRPARQYAGPMLALYLGVAGGGNGDARRDVACCGTSGSGWSLCCWPVVARPPHIFRRAGRPAPP